MCFMETVHSVNPQCIYENLINLTTKTCATEAQKKKKASTTANRTKVIQNDSDVKQLYAESIF